jgi:hypothetical protein
MITFFNLGALDRFGIDQLSRWMQSLLAVHE